MEHLEKLIFAAVFVVLLIFFGLRFRNKLGSPRTPPGAGITTTPTPQAPPAPQQSAPLPAAPPATPQPKKSTWKVVRVILGIALVMIALVIALSLVNHPSFRERVGGSVISTTPGFSPGVTKANMLDTEEPPLQIADCESGLRNSDGTAIPGSATHIRDGKVVRNPPNAGPGKGATGYWQIKQDDPGVKALLEEHDLDPEIEADNHAAAKLLWKKRKTAPWTASASCWAGKITMPGGIVITLEGLVSKWGGYFPLSRGFDFTTDWFGEGKPKHQIEYTLRDGTVIVNEFPSKDGKNIRIKGEVAKFRVKSLEKEPVIVKITLTPRT